MENHIAHHMINDQKLMLKHVSMKISCVCHVVVSKFVVVVIHWHLGIEYVRGVVKQQRQMNRTSHTLVRKLGHRNLWEGIS